MTSADPKTRARSQTGLKQWGRTAVTLAFALLLASLLSAAGKEGEERSRGTAAATAEAAPKAGERQPERRPDERQPAAEAAGPMQAFLADPRRSRRVLSHLTERRRQRTRGQLEAFYEQRDGQPAWTAEPRRRFPWQRSRRAHGEAEVLVAALAAAGEHGLDPGDYAVRALARRLRELDRRTPREEILALDARLTAAFLLYGNDLLNGRVEPDEVDVAWHVEPRQKDLAALLAAAIDRGGVRAALGELAPPHDGYRRLQAMLRHYREKADAGGWPEVPEGPVLEPGDEVAPERYAALVKRLAADGDLDREAARRLLQPRPAAATAGDGPAGREEKRRRPEAAAGDEEEETASEPRRPRYGRALAAAVERFQRRHGLLVDGKVGPETVAAMNRSAAERVRQIEINLERWRWVPADFGERYVLVNVPDFRLRAYDGGREALAMKVVTGQPSWATPVFSDRMTHVEINPYWHVPDSIAQQEILPKARQNPGWFQAEGYEWVDDRVRQRPGPNNALGRIKFMFPNQHNVYLHDTPAQSAFERDKRALSHGCVRIERPLDLAGFVFSGDREWDRSRVQQAIDGGRHQRVDLDAPLPVYLLYWTAFEDDGAFHFRPDLYGYDQALEEALARRQRARRGGGDPRT